MQRTLHRLIISGISILLGPVLQASISGQIYPMSQKRIFQSIDSELSYMAVRDITEDGNGFIWIATLKGLNKYDGYNITKFYAADGGLSSSCVESIEAIGKNVLIGTDKGVCIYDARDEKILPVKYRKPVHVQDISLLDGNCAAIGTEDGLLIYDIRTRDIVQADTLAIYKMTVDPSGTLWTVNDNNIITYYPDGRRKRIISPKTAHTKKPTLSEIYSDSKGMIWIGTMESGLYLFNKANETLTAVDTGNYTGQDMRFVRCITEDESGNNIWIGTENGLFIYDYTADFCEHYYKDSHKGNSGNINDNAVYSIFKSSDDIIWIGTFFGGINYTIINKSQFWTINDKYGNYFLDGAAVSSIYCDSRDRLWFTTENKGIFILDTRTQETQAINTGSFPRIPGNNVHAIGEDPYGYIWIGNFIDGLFRFSPDLKSQPQQFKNEDASDKLLPDNSVYCILSDRPDSMFIGFASGVSTYTFSTGQFNILRPDVLNDVRIDDIIRDKSGIIWMAAHFNGIYRYDPASQELQHFHSGNALGQDMTSNSIFCCFEDSSGDIWFGTNNGGILKYDRESRHMSSFGDKSALTERDIYFIDEDSSGNLWLSTDNGIYSFNPGSGLFLKYNIPIISNQFNYNAGYKNPVNGQIYFGSTNGVCCFQPEDIVSSGTGPVPEIFFSGLRINNEPITPSRDGTLKMSLDLTDRLVLDHNENTVSIDFICIDFNPMARNRYKCEYMLVGNDKSWIPAGMEQSCSYGNLKPGKYVFSVRILDNGNNTSETRKIEIRIKPHILLSPGAQSIYVILIICIGVFSIKSYRNRVNDRMNLRIQQIEKENLEMVNTHRTNFFTYISHEFKTPLTILMAIFEDIGQNSRYTIQARDVEIILHNTKRMMFLINQLSEFRLIKTNHEQICRINGDIVEFSRKIFSLFIPLFNRKHLKYQFSSSHQSFITYFDSDKIEKIISNILGNAVKYTIQENGTESAISFDISIDSGHKKIFYHCHDSGSNISLEHSGNILQPFSKTGTESQYSHFSNEIGLALVKELVDMMGGNIEIESDPGHGTSFTVSFPINENDGTEEVTSPKTTKNTREVIDDTIYVMDHMETGDIGTEDNAGCSSSQKKTILTIGTEPEIENFFRKKMKDEFNIRSLHNHSPEQIMAAAENADLIIYDTTDYELCKLIRKNDKTKHVPVIILTCEDSKENKIDALRAGASSVMSKPFSIEEITLKIKNLLESKNYIREYYAGLNKFNLEAIPSQKNERFIKRLAEIIEKNIQSEDLTIDFLSRQMNVSRTILYMRLKESLNMSATEFINKIRIDCALKMIHEGEDSVSDIAWKTGFSSPSYFSKIFKKHTGASPASYIKRELDHRTQK